MDYAVACDHAGFPAKKQVVGLLESLGHKVVDLGTHSTDPVDYPDYAAAAGEALLDGRAQRAVVLCGSGLGAAVAANKLPGIRAAVCHDTYSAHQGVEHDDINVLCLGTRVIGSCTIEEVVRTFAAAEFQREERYIRRLGKIEALEKRGS
jgi:ribose 5-phosphate isomerase B